jgi:hypothetical protein
LRILASFSFLLLLIFLSLWIRSELQRDWMWVRIPHGSGQNRSHLRLDGDSNAGQLEITWQTWSQEQFDTIRRNNELAERRFYHNSFDIQRREYWESYPPVFLNKLGFNYYTDSRHTSVYFPCWFACLLTGALPGIWFLRRQRRRGRVARGLCPLCGYDLRATPGLCPECGSGRVE